MVRVMAATIREGMTHSNPMSKRGSLSVPRGIPVRDDRVLTKEIIKAVQDERIYTYLSFILEAKSLRNVSTMSTGNMTVSMGAAMEIMVLIPKLEITQEKREKTITKTS